MQTQEIGRGAVVEFESADGPQRGTVEAVLCDTAFNRRLAAIRVRTR